MSRRRDRFVIGGVAGLAGLHKAVLASVPTNDDFMHRVYARELLAGQLPLRDFFDYGMGLMYALSAVAEAVIGHRLLAEAVIIFAATAISAALVCAIVRRCTGSLVFGVLATSLLVLAGPRSFSYPKMIVYAVAAFLWWRYAWDPRVRTAVALGAWAAVAYYWRPDHGALVALGTALAMVAAHHATATTVVRTGRAGVVALALVLPFWIFAATQVGFVTFVRSGFTAATAQHRVSQAPPRWPLRTLGDLVTIETAERFAPRIAIRWSGSSSQADRAAVLERHHLTVEREDGNDTQTVRLSRPAIDELRELIASPHVDDTAGVERGSATLPAATWPVWDRWRFAYAWLRVRVFPGIDEHTRAGAAAQVALYAIPIVTMMLGLIPAARRVVPEPVAGARLVWFSAFALVVNAVLIRTPYEVRANDAVVLPAILFGICLASVSRVWRSGGATRWLVGGTALIAVVFTVKSIAVTGEFRSGIDWLAGDWRSRERAIGAWREVGARLSASPPATFWVEDEGPVAARLAAYARRCAPAGRPILVLWFAPEIYYYADRRMGGRHVHFTPAFHTLPEEQRLEVDKVRRTAAPLAFAQSDFEEATREAFPAMMAHVDRTYTEVASLAEDGSRYRILARDDIRPSETYGRHAWPCYR